MIPCLYHLSRGSFEVIEKFSETPVILMVDLGNNPMEGFLSGADSDDKIAKKHDPETVAYFNLEEEFIKISGYNFQGCNREDSNAQQRPDNLEVEAVPVAVFHIEEEDSNRDYWDKKYQETFFVDILYGGTEKLGYRNQQF